MKFRPKVKPVGNGLKDKGVHEPSSGVQSRTETKRLPNCRRMCSFAFQFIPCVRGLDQLFPLGTCWPFARFLDAQVICPASVYPVETTARFLAMSESYLLQLTARGITPPGRSTGSPIGTFWS